MRSESLDLMGESLRLDWGQSPYTKTNPIPRTIIGPKPEILSEAIGSLTLQLYQESYNGSF